jgi:hypothetical protein
MLRPSTGATAEDCARTAGAPPAAADSVPSGSESSPIVIGPPLVFGVVRNEELAGGGGPPSRPPPNATADKLRLSGRQSRPSGGLSSS